MKLSMWMIANRLSPLMEISTNISLDAKPILNSARVAYSTNTAHVFQSGNNVVVEGEGDQITIFDIRLKEAFEIIQGVFDYYQDWESDMEAAVSRANIASSKRRAPKPRWVSLFAAASILSFLAYLDTFVFSDIVPACSPNVPFQVVFASSKASCPTIYIIPKRACFF